MHVPQAIHNLSARTENKQTKSILAGGTESRTVALVASKIRAAVLGMGLTTSRGFGEPVSRVRRKHYEKELKYFALIIMPHHSTEHMHKIQRNIFFLLEGFSLGREIWKEFYYNTNNLKIWTL